MKLILMALLFSATVAAGNTFPPSLAGFDDFWGKTPNECGTIVFEKNLDDGITRYEDPSKSSILGGIPIFGNSLEFRQDRLVLLSYGIESPFAYQAIEKAKSMYGMPAKAFDNNISSYSWRGGNTSLVMLKRGDTGKLFIYISPIKL